MEVTETTNVGGKSPRADDLPLVAIVGRPNVGKSTLFNRLVGARRAIVHDLPGMTRDRLFAEAEWDGRHFRVGDTGGIETAVREGIPASVREQAMKTVAEAAVVVFVVDGREGVMPADIEVAGALRKAGARHLLVAVNKADTVKHAVLAAEFASLGIEFVLAVSAETGAGLPELLDEVVRRLPDAAAGAAPPPADARPISVALVGRPNVGKSTLFNRLVCDERSIVSEVAGTTRDTVDVLVEKKGLLLRFVDTAGIRRPGRTEKGPEVLSVVMARKSIGRADVVVPVIDATEPITHQDAAVAGLADEAGRAVVLAFTKWDLVEDGDKRRREIEADRADALKFLAWAPLVTVSGQTGRGVARLLELIKKADASHRFQVSTARLNRFVERGLQGISLPAPGAKDARILYATQTGVRPPTFVFFVNRRIRPHFATLRFVANRLREEFGLEATPLRLRFRAREGHEKPRRPR